MSENGKSTAATIVVIDDEVSILNLVEAVLTRRGYTVAKAEDPLVGLALVEALSPEVVILDYMMPKLDGLQVLKQIRARFPDSYVMMFTGKGSEEIAVSLMKAGASDYILKPFNTHNLIERLENVLKIRSIEVKNRELLAEREKLLHEIKAWNEELEERIKLESEALRQAYAERVQSQKLVTLGYLAAGMAHEIRNPLNSISLFAQLIREGVGDAEKLDYVEKILGEVDRVDETLRKLLNSARRPHFEPVDVNIKTIIESTLESFSPKINAQKIAVAFDTSEDVPQIKADAAEIQQIFTNLLLNAIDEMPDGGKLLVRLHKEGDKFLIFVSDSGNGISEESLPNIFDPFFSTKTRGTGMGLPVVLRIVKNYGGRISVDNTGKDGTTFLVQLPSV